MLLLSDYAKYEESLHSREITEGTSQVFPLKWEFGKAKNLILLWSIQQMPPNMLENNLLYKLTMCSVHKVELGPKHFKYSHWWENAAFLKLTADVARN